MSKSYIITGGGGFIGRNLVSLIRREEPIATIVDVPRSVDLTEEQRTFSAFEASPRADYVFHLADVSGNHSWAANNAYTQTARNCRMHLNVVAAWEKYQSQAKFIFPSSVWAYPADIEIASESSYWEGALIPGVKHYGHSKKLADILLDALGRERGLKAITLVLGTTYGPGDKSDHFIPSVLRRMHSNRDELVVYGSGNESRDFIYVDDQVRGLYLHKDADSRMLNISSGSVTKTSAIVDLAAELMGYEGAVKYKDDPGIRKSGDVRGLSIEKAKSVTGWPVSPALTPLRDGLSKTIEDMYKNG